MEENLEGRAGKIRQVMQAFIDDRLAGKLEKLAADDPKREALIEQFAFESWVGDAARRVSQLQVVTHALKATHPDAKGSSRYVEPASLPELSLVGSHFLPSDFSGDVVGNAAALDVYKFLKLQHEGKSLLELALNGDAAFSAALSDNPKQAKEWAEAFAGITQPKGNEASHSLAKQLYWMVGDDPTEGADFHLLAPLYATSLAHQVFQRINADRFGEVAKEARQARRHNKPSEEGYSDYPNLAVQKLGGTKPQNISQLNSERGGNNYLLASLPPKWKSQGVKPPLHTETAFKRFGRRREVRWLAQGLVRFLKTDPPENRHTRNRVDGYIAALIDELVLFASEFQVLEPGWSAVSACRLPLEQQLWLDPWRAEEDVEFAQQREQGEWSVAIRAAFARWLNGWLKPLGVSDDEHREWLARIQRQLDILQEELPHG
ncbi:MULTISPECIES: type I-F CRISPR-associated protein Csy1 [unclassified Halomonas]|uniref:type I-F CRISPR-associated protein Csy1 n=1 Tax=unclassified Halomonas TaxID=2609666 RepID=UPI002884BAE1|nr:MULTISPECIES: type I-F CRISPR-associated protein Csy1 [unclassified Halomonas]MDT0499971.1 type I-F CRISPR-associated protein Csy1 [Halomonas sp. PAR7]MDT0512375.1 type I-F CRISPR-associated protein Csy1 [Halomonas sp. LES1]MDT0591009.1 type I-F CRISPR-associated protein Csy1 [Halomonas sp. PAR8]